MMMYKSHFPLNAPVTPFGAENATLTSILQGPPITITDGSRTLLQAT
jgi:hypothetical protein